jgi:alkylation response protein AidB-like acyl-CoA dehydrogenase
MNFDFTDDQRALADTVRRFVARDYGFERRRRIRDSATGWSRDVWQELAELGVLAIGIDEDHGGLGYGPLETGLVMNAFGAGLLLEPYLAAAVIAPALIRRAASADFQARVAAADRHRREHRGVRAPGCA